MATTHFKQVTRGKVFFNPQLQLIVLVVPFVLRPFMGVVVVHALVIRGTIATVVGFNNSSILGTMQVTVEMPDQVAQSSALLAGFGGKMNNSGKFHRSNRRLKFQH